MHQSENEKEFLLGCRKEREWYMIIEALMRFVKFLKDIVYDFGNTEPEGGIQPKADASDASSDDGNSGNSQL